jgi:hypothetical protein
MIVRLMKDIKYQLQKLVKEHLVKRNNLVYVETNLLIKYLFIICIVLLIL